MSAEPFGNDLVAPKISSSETEISGGSSGGENIEN